MPSGGADLLDDRLGDVAIKVVHDHVRAPLREEQRIAAADAAPAAADEHDLIVEADGVCWPRSTHFRRLRRRTLGTLGSLSKQALTTHYYDQRA